MTKRTIVLFAMFLTLTAARAQLTLDSCKLLARANYPAIKQLGLVEQSRQFNVSNASKDWLPQVNVMATAAWFTDIIDLPQQTGQILGSMGNSLYNGGVQINQPIYDGGAIAARKRMAIAEANVSQERTNVTLYAVNSRIEQLYFGTLTIDERLRQNALLQDNLAIGMRTVEALERGGMANRSDIEAISVEQLKARQQEEQLRAQRKAYLLMLSTFINRSLGEAVVLAVPARPTVEKGVVRRPELEFYAAKDRLLTEQRRSLDAKLMPRLSAFGLGMYHNKVLGTMKNSLLAGGFTLSWNIGALYTRQNDRRIIDTERQLNATERETFLFNTGLQTAQSAGVVDALERQIKLDDSIITLRQSILDKAGRKVQNGTETVNEMLRDINNVSEARLQKALHELQLTQELYNQQTINNN